MNQHHLVVAVQDWGGTQESWRAWDQSTREDAEGHAAQVADADSAYVSGDIDRSEAARAKYGDDHWSDLISDNVCPGWNAIWIVPCAEPCGFDAAFDKAVAERGRSLGEPWWTPEGPTYGTAEPCDDPWGDGTDQAAQNTAERRRQALRVVR